MLTKEQKAYWNLEARLYLLTCARESKDGKHVYFYGRVKRSNRPVWMGGIRSKRKWMVGSGLGRYSYGKMRMGG